MNGGMLARFKWFMIIKRENNNVLLIHFQNTVFTLIDNLNFKPNDLLKWYNLKKSKLRYF